MKVRDVDFMASKEDVVEAFQKIASEGNSVECKVLGTGLLGMQVAVVACSEQLAWKVIVQGRIKID